MLPVDRFDPQVHSPVVLPMLPCRTDVNVMLVAIGMTNAVDGL